MDDMITRLERAYIAAREAGNQEKMQMYATGIRKYQANQEEDGFSLYKTMQNIPESGGNMISDIANVVAHPVDTATGVYNLGSGAIQKLIPGEQGNEVYADAFGSFIKDRYGSGDAILNTIQNDPMGFLGDLSSVLMPAGAVAKQLPGMARAGNIVQKAGAIVDPFNMIKMGLTKPLPSSVPEGLYQSAAKYTAKYAPDQAHMDELVRTGLKHELPPTDTGLPGGYGARDAIDAAIDSLVNDANVTGKLIHKNTLMQHLGEARKRFGGAKLYADADLKQIDTVGKQFDTRMKDLGQEFLTPAEVQDFKKSIYSRNKYEKRNQSTTEAREIAEKGMARSAKEQLEVLSPELKETNAEWARVNNWIDATEGSARRIGNRDIMGIGVPIKAAAAEAVVGSGGGVLGLLHGIADSPRFKARMAIQLKKMKENGVTLTPAVINEILFQVGRETDEQFNYGQE